jgi:hypothetical protein
VEVLDDPFEAVVSLNELIKGSKLLEGGERVFV